MTWNWVVHTYVAVSVTMVTVVTVVGAASSISIRRSLHKTIVCRYIVNYPADDLGKCSALWMNTSASFIFLHSMQALPGLIRSMP